MPNKQVNIIVSAKDLTKGAFNSASSGVKKLSKTTTAAFTTMAKATAASTAALYGLSKVGERGGKIEGVATGFKKNFKDSEDALNSLRKASLGTISDYDLMLSSNRAAMLGVTDDSKTLSKLLEIAAGRAQELGIETTKAFDDIVVGIGRGSPLILDNLGITTDKFQDMRDEIEATGKELSEAEKQQLLLASVMEDSAKPIENAATQIASMKAELVNLKDKAITLITPYIVNFFERLREAAKVIAEHLQPKIEELKMFFQDELLPRFQELSNWVRDEIIPRLGEFVTKAGELWEELGPVRDAILDLLDELVLPALLKGIEKLIEFATWLIDNTTKVVKFFNENEEAALALGVAITGIVTALVTLKTVALASGIWSGLTAAVSGVSAAIAFGPTCLIASIGGIGVATVAAVAVAGAALAGLAIYFQHAQQQLSAFEAATDEVRARANTAEDQVNMQRRAARAGMSTEDFAALDSAGRTAALRAAEGRSSGGYVEAGRPYIVGEERPELFVPKESGTILPSVSGINISNVNINNAMDFAAFTTELGLALGII